MVTTVTGIVINKKNYQEYDEIVTIFSPEYGKISFYALGTRKLVSKNKYGLQLFATSEFQIFLSKTNRLSKLKTAILLKNRLDLTNNYDNYLLAILVIEIIDQGWEKSFFKKTREIYNLVTATLDLFLQDSNNLWLLNYFYFWSLKLFGLQWQLNACVRCQQLHRIRTISFFEEGFLCVLCLKKEDYLFDIEIVKMIFQWNKEYSYQISNISTSFKTLNQAVIFLQMICEYLLNKAGIYSPSIYQMKKNSIYFPKK